MIGHESLLKTIIEEDVEECIGTGKPKVEFMIQKI